MITDIKGDAFAIATLLRGKDLDGVEDALYHLIDNGNYGGEERKADLYANLVETINPGQSFEDMAHVVQHAMCVTDKRFPWAA